MRSNLPLSVLGFMGPILSWVEGTDGLRFPESWLAEGIPPREREQAWLVRELPTYSYDNVDEIIDLGRQALGSCFRQGRRLSWAKRVPREMAPPPGYDLAATFRRLGERYFRWNSSELFVQEGKMEELHELALRFPVAHLIRSMHARAASAGYLTAERVLELPEQLSLLHTSSHGLRTVVHRGVSEGHMHFSGVITADEVWADHLLQTVTPASIRGFSLQDRRLLGLSRAAVRLLALGVLLAIVPLKKNLHSVPFRLVPYLDEIYLARNRAEERTPWKDLREAVREEAAELADLVPAAVRSDAAWLLRLADPSLPKIWRALAPQEDGMARQAPEGIRQRIRLLERLHFVVHKLLIDLPLPDEGRPMEGPQIARELLHQIFFRYVVYQTHDWQLATQSGKTTGLRQFKRYFDSPQRNVRTLSAAEEKGLILERLRRADYLRDVEGRISMPRGPRELIPWVLGYAEGAQKKQLDGFGFVIHFLKAERDKADERAGRANAGRNRIVRYGRIRRKTRAEAFRLFRLLSTPHPVVPFIVGIDAANLELPTPPEVFAPAFRFLREYPIDVRGVDAPLDRFGTRREILSLLENRRLGMTYHVGEEFRHLLSGLRAITEAIEFLNPRAGDRLGHAIALAIEPEVWAEQIGYQAVLPKQEWLDTLVWVHHFLGPGADLLGELGIEDEVQQLSRAVYGSSGASDWPLPTLHDAWRLRQLDPYSLDMGRLIRREYRIREQSRHGAQRQRWADVQARVLRQVNESVGSNQAYRLLNLYWYHSTVRREGDRIETVDMLPKKEAWIAVCRTAQEKVKKLIQARELIVEVNPSSNRLIGPFPELSKHHIFRMTLNDAHRLAREVRVTVNTDDPGVFNTSLAHEYYLLGEILLQKGVPEAEVVNWLNWLRENGNDSCFVRTLPDRDDPRIKKVLEALQGSSQTLWERMGGSRSRLPDLWSAFWRRCHKQKTLETTSDRSAPRAMRELLRDARPEDVAALAQELAPYLDKTTPAES